MSDLEKLYEVLIRVGQVDMVQTVNAAIKRNKELEEMLEYYAEKYCKLGHTNDLCGKISSMKLCEGCHARKLLDKNSEYKSQIKYEPASGVSEAVTDSYTESKKVREFLYYTEKALEAMLITETYTKRTPSYSELLLLLGFDSLLKTINDSTASKIEIIKYLSALKQDTVLFLDNLFETSHDTRVCRILSESELDFTIGIFGIKFIRNSLPITGLTEIYIEDDGKWHYKFSCAASHLPDLTELIENIGSILPSTLTQIAKMTVFVIIYGKPQEIELDRSITCGEILINIINNLGINNLNHSFELKAGDGTVLNTEELASDAALKYGLPFYFSYKVGSVS